MRARLRNWLRSCDIGAKTVQDVLVAVGEACANAIEHGHRHSPGQQIRLRAVSTADQLRLTITDTGRWRTSQPGTALIVVTAFALMRALMQQVTIEPGPDGTTVDMYVGSPMATPLELSTPAQPRWHSRSDRCRRDRHEQRRQVP